MDDRVDGGLNLLLGDRVHRGGGLVQDEDLRLGQDRTGKAQKLLFAGGEQVAPLAHVGVQPLFQLLDHALGAHELQGGVNILIRGVGVAVEQIVPHGAGEEMRRLQHIADRVMQPELGALPRVPSVDEHPPRRRLIEAANEICQRRFARAGLPHDGEIRAKGDFEVEVL